MNYIKEVLLYIMSGVEVIPFIGNYIIAVGAILLRFMWGVAARDKLSPATPVKFSLRFFISDNGARIFTYCLGLFFILLLSSDIIGLTASKYVGFVVGLFIEDIIYKLLSSRPEILNTFFNRGKTNTKMAFEYVFKIPTGATEIKLNEQVLNFEEAAQQLKASIDNDELIIQEDTPETLEFLIGSVSNFVGHVPRPK